MSDEFDRHTKRSRVVLDDEREHEAFTEKERCIGRLKREKKKKKLKVVKKNVVKKNEKKLDVVKKNEKKKKTSKLWNFVIMLK